MLELLGEGNFGSVYKGIWQRSVLIAMKKLKNESELSSFRREAMALQ